MHLRFSWALFYTFDVLQESWFAFAVKSIEGEVAIYSCSQPDVSNVHSLFISLTIENKSAISAVVDAAYCIYTWSYGNSNASSFIRQQLNTCIVWQIGCLHIAN